MNNRRSRRLSSRWTDQPQPVQPSRLPPRRSRHRQRRRLHSPQLRPLSRCAAPAPAAPPPPPQPVTITLPAGTVINVHTDSELGSKISTSESGLLRHCL